MVDINKYLETQLALAEQRSQAKKNINVSEKSITAAERIAKKQDKNLPKSKHKEEVRISSQKTGSCKGKESGEDSEYLPSCDEDDEIIHLPNSASTSRRKKELKKIIDDGNKKLYNERVKTWRQCLVDAQSGTYNGSCLSADIQYVLDGNKDVDGNHELQNGLCIPNYIWKQLYKYQRTGVKWLWELHQTESGGLLGDEMGLGKTVQIIAFLAGLAQSDSRLWNGLGPSIIVAPATVIYQWVSHFHYWYPALRVAVLHRTGSHEGNHNKLIRDLHEAHGLLLISYAGVAKYCNDLLSRNWHYLILDEGHKIRNPEAQVSKFVKQFKTPHKILITGSPMQNSLQELWSLFDFMRPGLLGTYTAFMEHFAAPITQGGYANATDMQEATALEIAKALKNIITPYMLRRTKAEVQEHINLPEKNEQVLFCALSQEQRDLYMGYLMSSTVRSILDKETRYGDPFRPRVLVAMTTLRKICNHPDLYLFEAQDDIDDIDEETFGHYRRSGKMTVVHSLLKIWQKQGHRALIFSQSRAMICLLEQYLQRHRYKYLRMDGTVSVSLRQNLIKTFNDNAEYLVFLSTTRVGGLGVNLTGANRVIIYDPDWNPATDNQAKERAWRIGQERNVTVYRLLSAGTIEEKIYQRQIFKNFLSNKVLIDPSQKNVLTTSTLHGLFTLDEPNNDGDTETASLFQHTKVNFKSKHQSKDTNRNISTSCSTSHNRIAMMRRMARDISKKISQNSRTTIVQEDPREKYKKKRELLLNPPKIEEPEINLIDDKVTDVPFENVLSELDIVNMHVKENYEENLIKEVLENQKNVEKEVCEENESGKQNSDESKPAMDNVQNAVNHEDNKIILPPDKFLHNSSDVCKSNEKKDKKAIKRKSSTSEVEIDNLVAVKKVKYKKKDKEKKSDDDYVLSKLFAKANVRNALQHDAVIGLAEKERRHKLKEEATRSARKALKAIKHSTKRKKE